MRPRNGVLECIRCADAGRARTVIHKGKRQSLSKGQIALGGRDRQVLQGVEPALEPKEAEWRPHKKGEPHPQLGLFPHPNMRDGQRRFARDVTRAVGQGKHLVANAPTGIGKTAAALAPALQAALEQEKVVFFLTSRQSQHRIAVDTLRAIQEERGADFGLVDLVGKRDMCLRPEVNEMHPSRFPDFCARETRTKSCRFLGDVDEDTLQQVRAGVLHVEELMAVSRTAGLCPHLVAMTAATQAHVVVADYNHLFSDIREQSLERLGVALEDLIVIVDEAHNLPDRIRQSHAHRISDFLLDQVKGEARRHKFRQVEADCDSIRDALVDLAGEAQREGKAENARISDDDAQVARLEVNDLHRAFERTRSAVGFGSRTLQDVMDDLTPLVAKVRRDQEDQVWSEQLLETLEDWGRFQSGALRYVEWDDAGGISLHVRLLDPSIPARSIFDQVHASVLMSGTLRPPEMTRDLLGLAAERTAVKAYDSPFPPEHRAVIIDTTISTRYQERGPKLWDSLSATIQDLAESTPGNIAVFTPSYAIMRDVRSHTRDVRKEAIVEDPDMGKQERDLVLDRLRGALGKNGAILWGVLGGSFSEGVDFNDNLLSAVVIIGLPLAPPDLEVQATIGYMDAKFPGKGRKYGYVYPAMNKALQAMGRGIRGPNDKCAVLLLDKRYMEMQYRELLPPGCTPSPDPAFTAASFFAMHGQS